MAGSPYTYKPVTEDLVRLSAEIESLSGRSLDGQGASAHSHWEEPQPDVSALVGVSHVSCRICGKREDREEEKEEVVALKGQGQRVLGAGGGGGIASDMDVIAVRDPRAPSTALAEDAVRRYKVTRAFSPWTPQERVYEDQGKLVTDWVWRGFNATLVSFGQQGTGKSYTLYNDGLSLSFPQDRGLAAESGVDEACGLLIRILADLFSRIAKDRREDGGGRPFMLGDTRKQDRGPAEALLCLRLPLEAGQGCPGCRVRHDWRGGPVTGEGLPEPCPILEHELVRRSRDTVP